MDSTETRRTFLKQLGLLSLVVGSGLELPALAERRRWCGLPVPLLTEVQKRMVVSSMNWPYQLAMTGLPDGVRFLRRIEDAHGDRWGCAIKVTRHGHRVKRSVEIDPSDVHSYEAVTRRAVDCLCEWYDRVGCKAISMPENVV